MLAMQTWQTPLHCAAAAGRDEVVELLTHWTGQDRANLEARNTVSPGTLQDTVTGLVRILQMLFRRYHSQPASNAARTECSRILTRPARTAPLRTWTTGTLTFILGCCRKSHPSPEHGSTYP